MGARLPPGTGHNQQMSVIFMIIIINRDQYGIIACLTAMLSAEASPAA